MTSGRSSAISPGPASAPASPCSQTAAAGRLEARHALGEAARDKPRQHVARPGGGEPGRRIVGDRSAAIRRGHHGVGALEQHDRARLPRTRCVPSQASSEMSSVTSLNNRANSPSCGVRTVAPARPRMAPNRASAPPQSWSAHRRRAPPRARRQARRGPARASRRPTPPPGPSTTALRRRSLRNSVSSSAPSTGRTITASVRAALTAARRAGWRW